ncbi:hypothetical protein cypCar_00034130 [Cyprinus carpio]|nr:hypothetical protein cypCar_00034130 [Cyprinus carpio]
MKLLYEIKPGLLQRWDALDGQNIEELIFDIENNKTQTKMTWQPWDQQKWIRVKYMYANVYYPLCMKVLRRYLYMEKNNVLREVKPRVRLMRKTLSDSQGLQISCLATGFYPRHINLTLFRDGQPVEDDLITGGQILPNGDGTYQMRKSLVISEEELREEHKYNCTMKHLNLETKLDIQYVAAESDPGSFSQFVVFSVLVFMCVAVFIITALIIWRRRRAAGQGSTYSPATCSHSLMVFGTYIAGQTQFPEFTLLLMLDDVEVMYYDSVSLKAVHRSQSNSSDDNGAGSIFSDIYDIMKDRTFYLKDHQNCTDVKPKVRLFRKPLTDSQGLQISCLATGFYPRHINLTLSRDGQPVDEDLITGGQILPNGDGTYQMRKSLVISEEKQHNAYYKCTANYLNLDNKLDIAFDEDLEKSDFGSSALSIIISVLMFMCVVVFIITALIKWRKRRAAGPGSSTSHHSGYSPTSISEQETT